MTVSDQVRTYGVSARQTDVFGRVVCSARDQHFVVDGPVQNGCPGEAVTPVEVFLTGVAACGVELLQVLARQSELPLSSVAVDVTATLDRGAPVHPTYSVLNTVGVHFRLGGVSQDQGEELVKSFKGR